MKKVNLIDRETKEVVRVVLEGTGSNRERLLNLLNSSLKAKET